MEDEGFESPAPDYHKSEKKHRSSILRMGNEVEPVWQSPSTVMKKKKRVSNVPIKLFIP